MLERHKDRVVIREDNQNVGVDYINIFSLMVNMSTIRTIIAFGFLQTMAYF